MDTSIGLISLALYLHNWITLSFDDYIHITSKKILTCSQFIKKRLKKSNLDLLLFFRAELKPMPVDT